MKTSVENQLMHEENALLRVQTAQMVEQISALKQQLDWFKRQMFGRKSEKQIFDNPNQAQLFNAPDASPQTPHTTEIKSHQRQSNKNRNGNEVNDTGLRFDENVPQKIIEITPPELKGEEADQYEIIDYKEDARLAQQPGSYTVLIYRRPVIRHKQQQTVSSSAAPTNVLEGCYADVSLIAGLMVDKAVYHLPLYRQHQRMLDSGIQLSRATLTNWLKKGIELLRPIYRAQWQHILESQVLGMDEVPIKAGRKKKGQMKQTYYWPIYGEDDEIVFTWSSSRSHQHALEQLQGFSGTLLTDGYAAYNTALAKLNATECKITHANCWAHSRRKFEQALKMEPELAQHALDMIARLYRNEAHCRDSNMQPDEVLKYRQKHSEPMVNAFFVWAYNQRQNPGLLPSNPLSKAIAYISEREHELKVFLGNPSVAIDTNHVERNLRPIPMGRKNYLFCWTELGAEHMGILQSLMVTCRLQGVNPYHYLVDVLQRVSMHPSSAVDELTPRIWKDKFKDNFLTSDLEEKGQSTP